MGLSNWNKFFGSGLIALIGEEEPIDKQTDCCVVNHD
ncbi:hypothetical protein SAMN05216167_13240 [Spirosoma endophyticum]|uniref:Uncharacterized protein n=1 Tax=Spirosoma endophyticum TaxID=662367 RepID=A0A1I2GI05_9BACT|nr:hypothetical protein SAMN05216167_13240 [Spirosoma endophyticum]